MSELRGMKDLFAGRHFDRDVIILCVRWYLCYKLSFRDLVEMMAERGLHLSHTTIMRWVQRYAPEFERRWTRFARKVGLTLAKIPSACIFIAFHLARVGRSSRLLTVKISRLLFNFSAGWSFGEAQLPGARSDPGNGSA